MFSFKKPPGKHRRKPEPPAVHVDFYVSSGELSPEGILVADQEVLAELLVNP